MKHEDLIKQFSSGLQPVKKIDSIQKTLFIWGTLTFLSILLFIYFKSNSFQYIHIPEYLWEDLMIFLIVVTSSFYAIKLSIPGLKIKRKFQWIPVLLILVWIFLLFGRELISKPEVKELEYVYHDCITDLVFMSVASLFTIFYIVSRRVPFKKELIGFWINLSSISAASIGISILCPDESPKHLFLIHLLPTVGISMIGILIGNKLLKSI